ncbi:MAG: cupin domain-containing protein [Clostridia bacterium]|nr:cupin domain-containing protein [Clostridia bacterium]
MFVGNTDTVKAVEMNDPTVKNASMKAVIGPEQGWDSHVMRVIELEEEGYSPKHNHPWPHINYVIDGEGCLFANGEEKILRKGTVAFIPSGEVHQFKNCGKGKLVFICIVPKEGHQ